MNRTRQASSANPRIRAAAQFAEHFQKGREYLLQALNIDEKNKEASDDPDNKRQRLEACELYKKGIDEFKKAYAINTMDIPEECRKDISEAKKKMDGFMSSAQDRFLTLFKQLQLNNVPSTVQASTSAGPRTMSPAKRSNRAAAATNQQNKFGRTPAKSVLLRGVDPKIGEKLLDEILESTGVSLTDVCGCDTAKSALEEAVVLPNMNPELFSGLRQPVKGILLFGPPGNGKTMLAKAVANESGHFFFNVSAASLMSKWVGETEKTMRSLFQIARNAQPSIIFIDEIDSMLCDRSDKDSEVSRRVKTEFLVQFDGASSNPDDRILVVGATNRPQELDDAVLRRFAKRILLGLPDDAGRYSLVKSILTKHGMMKGLHDSELKYIASRTSGYSNSDLVALCKEAAMVPVREIEKNKLKSTDSSKLRNLKASDFDKALTMIKPSSNRKHMDALSEFARKTGC